MHARLICFSELSFGVCVCVRALPQIINGMMNYKILKNRHPSVCGFDFKYVWVIQQATPARLPLRDLTRIEKKGLCMAKSKLRLTVNPIERDVKKAVNALKKKEKKTIAKLKQFLKECTEISEQQSS